MITPKTTIELNGKQYDARTGKIIANSSNSTSITTPTKTIGMIDGFIKRTNLSSLPKDTSKVSLASINQAKKSLAKSKTLMRSSVKKPEIKNDIQRIRYAPRPNLTDVKRESKAISTEKSNMISRFSKLSMNSSVKKSIEHLPIVSAPNVISGTKKAVHTELEKFEQALRNANTHIKHIEKNVVKKVPLLKRAGFKNKIANLSAISAGFLLLIGFFGYQNATYVSMKVASQRSGITAKMPGYVPAGFSANKTANSGDGRVSLSFNSNSDAKGFTLTQQTSDWNSSSLLANYVQKRNCPTCYQTWPSEGRTLFIYDESNATWVDGGIWYQVEGNAVLTTDQLQRLANSL